MAVKFATPSGEKAGRSDVFTVSPTDIQPGIQSRFVKSPTFDADVLKIASSFITVGQIDPVICRKDNSGVLRLVLGNTRLAAALLVRKGFTDAEGRHHRDPEFMIAVKIDKLTDEQAMDLAVAENQARNDTTDLQEALAQQYYRDTRKWNDTQIAHFYGYTNTNRVMSLKKLLTLPEAVQQKVHRREMSLSAAVDIAKAPEEVRQDLIAKIETGAAGGEEPKVDSAEVRRQIRKKAEEQAEQGGSSGGTQNVTTVKRTIKDFKDFAGEVLLSMETDVRIKAMFSTMAEWFAGEKTDRQLWNKIDAVQGLIPAKSIELSPKSE